MIARATRAPVELPALLMSCFFSTRHSSSNRASPNPIAPHFHRPGHSGEEIRQESLALRQIYHAFLQHPFFPSLSFSVPQHVLFINRYLCASFTPPLFQILFLNYVYNRSQKSPCILRKLYSNESCYNRNRKRFDINEVNARM